MSKNEIRQLFSRHSSTPLSRELLPNLVSLNFNDNKLTQLPELKRLGHLKELGGAGNYLDPVPDILQQLPNPWFRSIWYNPQARWFQRGLSESILQPRGGAAELSRLTESMSGGEVYGADRCRTEPTYPLHEMQTLPVRRHTRG